jgi:hypothetical protein
MMKHQVDYNYVLHLKSFLAEMHNRNIFKILFRLVLKIKVILKHFIFQECQELVNLPLQFLLSKSWNNNLIFNSFILMQCLFVIQILSTQY